MDGWSAATKATSGWMLWANAVETSLVALGVSGEWLREQGQRARMSRYYEAGEPVWMAADTLRQFWLGTQRDARSAKPPQCPVHGFVMVENFDYQQVSEAVTRATPNGTFTCFACKRDAAQCR